MKIRCRIRLRPLRAPRVNHRTIHHGGGISFGFGFSRRQKKACPIPLQEKWPLTQRFLCTHCDHPLKMVSTILPCSKRIALLHPLNHAHIVRSQHHHRAAVGQIIHPRRCFSLNAASPTESHFVHQIMSALVLVETANPSRDIPDEYVRIGIYR